MELLMQEGGNSLIPPEVVELVIHEQMPLCKAWRLHKGLSVEEVALRAGLDPVEVERLEWADNQPSYSLERLAAALELDLDQIVDI
ncbi:MAG: hypothetical protein Kow0089_24460 [Desulfobulbaceae bacterium]